MTECRCVPLVQCRQYHGSPSLHVCINFLRFANSPQVSVFHNLRLCYRCRALFRYFRVFSLTNTTAAILFTFYVIVVHFVSETIKAVGLRRHAQLSTRCLSNLQTFNVFTKVVAIVLLLVGRCRSTLHWQLEKDNSSVYLHVTLVVPSGKRV